MIIVSVMLSLVMLLYIQVMLSSVVMIIYGRKPCRVARGGAMVGTQSSHSALGWRDRSALGWRDRSAPEAGSAPCLAVAPSDCAPGCLRGSGPSLSGILCCLRGIPFRRGDPMQRGIPQFLNAAPFSGVALGWWRRGMLRAPRGGGAGSRPGNVWLSTL